MEGPKWPDNTWHSDGYMGPPCPYCGSDYPKKYILLGKRNCIKKGCPNHKGTRKFKMENIK